MNCHINEYDPAVGGKEKDTHSERSAESLKKEIEDLKSALRDSTSRQCPHCGHSPNCRAGGSQQYPTQYPGQWYLGNSPVCGSSSSNGNQICPITNGYGGAHISNRSCGVRGGGY